MTDLVHDLAQIGLRHTSLTLDDLVALATKRRWSHTQLLEHIAKGELDDRAKRSLERRLARSRLGRFKPMADFDWSWPKRIDRPQVERALHLEFLHDAHNLVLVAPQGLGKSMIAQNVGYQAVLAGHHVLFTTAAQILLDLSAQDSPRALDRRLHYYANQPHLLIIDEVGYLSFDPRNADLLFQVVSRRYEKRSLAITTNLPFSEWPKIFPNASCTVALVDRIVHYADIIQIEGSSYRRRQAELAQTTRKTPSK